MPAAELLDEGNLTYEQTLRALADLRRSNRLLFGYRALIRSLLPRLGSGPEPSRLLDVGTGSGDTAAALVRAAARRGKRVEITGVDLKPGHLLLGRRRYPEQHRVSAAADALPFADGAFDWAFSTLFFHHFDAQLNRRILAEMRRVSRRGVVVVDLHRSPWLRLLIRPGLRLLGTGPVAYHDGLVSAAQSWTIPEVAELVRGLPVRELRRRFPFRFSLILGPLTPEEALG